MTSKTRAAVALAIGLMLAATAALAHDISGPAPTTAGGKAALARHDNFRQIGAASKAINDELRKDDPSPAVLATASARLKDLSGRLPGWFPRGSGPESKFKTDAKPEVWSDAAGFAAAAKNFQTQAAKMQQLAAAGDIAGMKGQARALGGTCKACHDKFRVPEKR